MLVTRIDEAQVSAGRGTLVNELKALYDAAQKEPGQWFRLSCPTTGPIQTLRKFAHLEVRAKKNKQEGTFNIDIKFDPNYNYVPNPRVGRPREKKVA
jgi:hypothetical protein